MANSLNAVFLTEHGAVSTVHFSNITGASYDNFTAFLSNTGYVTGMFNLSDIIPQYPVASDYNERTRVCTLRNGNHCDLMVYRTNNNSIVYHLEFYDKNHDSSPFTHLDYSVEMGYGESIPSFLVFALSSDETDIGRVEIVKNHNRDQIDTSILDTPWNVLTSEYNLWVNGSVANEDPYQTAPDSEPDGGYGDFDYSGDPILPPGLPTISVVDSGFVTLYKPTLSQLRSLASYMWSGLFDVSAFKKIFADPMDCIISLSIIPIDAPAGAAQELKVGNIGTGININVLSEQFVKVQFATRNIGLRANNFADYSPYTKCQLFLPYVGCQSLNIDDIAGADIDIEYHIDLFSGACTAYVTCTKRNSDGSTLHSTMYQFTGNVIANIPFTATNFQSFISSVIGTVVKTGAAVATGGGAAIAGAAGSAINTAMSMKPDVERSGNLSTTSGFLGIQKPYLILTYPNLCIPENRDKTVGTPSFIGLGMRSGYGNKKLSDFHGLTILHKVNVKNIPCTEAEKEMIAAQLTGEGVIMP